ncbi:MAG: phosphoglycerate dehydrogenase [Planctomycetota bacterium]
MEKVLISDKLPQTTIQMIRDAGYDVENRPDMEPDELKEELKDAAGVICRSGSQLTEQVLSTADKLKVICRAGVGVDNIDIPAASRKGIVVMNTPGANTISTAEHTFALMLGLSRNIGPAYISMRDGKWERKKYTGAQLSGTVLGVVGLGKVGRAVAERGKAFEMDVMGFDPYISREKASKLGIELADELGNLLAKCDYLTIHVPVNEQTRGMIGDEEIKTMKSSARIINCARGPIVDQDAVVAAVQEGELAGAAFDVYDEEPPEDFDFARHNQILATPHLGASTEAAQEAVGAQAADQLINALEDGYFRNALNISPVPPEEMSAVEPFCDLLVKMGKMAGSLNRARPERIEVTCNGEVAEFDTTPLVNYGTLGVLQSVLGGNVNIVSAPHIADERGIKIQGHTSTSADSGFTDQVSVSLHTEEESVVVSGTVLGGEHARIVNVAGFETEINPEGHLVMLFTPDKPGVVGQVGMSLGESDINIAQMTFGREEEGGNSLVALKLDNPCDEDTMEELRRLDVVDRAVAISL